MGPYRFPSTCVPSAIPELWQPMLGQGLPGNGATGCCAVHLSPIVTVLFCLVCTLDCVTGEVRRSNQALSNGLQSPAAGKNRGSACRGKGKGRRCACACWEHPRYCRDGTAPGTAAGQAPGRRRALHRLGENLGQGCIWLFAVWLHPCKTAGWRGCQPSL